MKISQCKTASSIQMFGENVLFMFTCFLPVAFFSFAKTYFYTSKMEKFFFYKFFDETNTGFRLIKSKKILKSKTKQLKYYVVYPSMLQLVGQFNDKTDLIFVECF